MAVQPCSIPGGSRHHFLVVARPTRCGAAAGSGWLLCSLWQCKDGAASVADVTAAGDDAASSGGGDDDVNDDDNNVDDVILSGVVDFSQFCALPPPPLTTLTPAAH